MLLDAIPFLGKMLRVCRCSVRSGVGFGLLVGICCASWVVVAPQPAQGVMITLSQSVDGLKEFDTCDLSRQALERLAMKLEDEYPADAGEVVKIRKAIRDAQGVKIKIGSEEEIDTGNLTLQELQDLVTSLKVSIGQINNAIKNHGYRSAGLSLGWLPVVLRDDDSESKSSFSLGPVSFDDDRSVSPEQSQPPRHATLFAGKKMPQVGDIPRDHLGPGRDPLETYLGHPVGLAVFSDGRVLVADENNSRLLMIAADGKTIEKYASLEDGDYWLTDIDQKELDRIYKLGCPRDVAVFPDGRALAADTNNNRVMIVNSAGTRMSVLVNESGEMGDRLDSDSKQTQLHTPYGVAVLPDGRSLIVDTGNNRVLVVSADRSTTKLFAGFEKKKNYNFSSANWNTTTLASDDPTQIELHYPNGVAVFPDSRVLIADTSSNRVLVVSADGTEIKFFAGTGREPTKKGSGYPWERFSLESDDPTEVAIRPISVAVLPDGKALISCEEFGRMLVVSSDGKHIEPFIGTHDKERPDYVTYLSGSHMAAFPDGRVLISCGEQIWMVDLTD